MDIPILLEDLIKHFEQQRNGNLQAIEQTDRVISKLRRPLAYRFLLNGLSLFLELLLWVALVACVAAILFMEKLYPFSILSQLSLPVDFPEITVKDIHLLVWTSRGLFLLLGLAFLWIARLLAKARKRAKVAVATTKSLKDLMEQLLQQRSAIRQLSLKYPVDLSEDTDTVAVPRLEAPKQEPEGRGDNPDDILL